MKKLLYFLLIGVVQASAQQTGLIYDDLRGRLTYTAKLDESAFASTRGGSESPISYSLEKYLPPIGNQANTPSCVGWASAYYGMTAVKRIEQGLDYPVVSPWSVYNRYQQRKFKNSCYTGCWIEDVLNILHLEGSPSLEEYSYKSCATDKSTNPYPNKLESWTRIGSSRNQIKSALLLNYPVVIAVPVMSTVYEHSLSSKYVDENGILKLNSFEESRVTAGHAMCIVAYNDTLDGGAFKIVNSWGTDWGKNGFCWLRYADLKYVSEAFALIASKDKQRKESGAFLTDRLSFFNSSDSIIYLSVAYQTTNGLQSRGWFSINPGSKREIDVSDRSTNEVYWSCLNQQGKKASLSCQTTCREISVETSRAFELYEGQKANEQMNFVKYDPLNVLQNEDVVVEFISNKEGSSYTHRVSKGERSLLELNKNWKGDGPLIDPLTSELIIRDPKSKEETVVYVLLEDGSIKEVKGTAKTISKYKQLKFLTNNNAKDYISLTKNAN